EAARAQLVARPAAGNPRVSSSGSDTIGDSSRHGSRRCRATEFRHRYETWRPTIAGTRPISVGEDDVITLPSRPVRRLGGRTPGRRPHVDVPFIHHIGVVD